MPLMQLRTLVLPAPFGPISASNSPASTVSETSVSTASPPKRSDKCSTASSLMRTLRQRRILTQGAIRPALRAAGLTEIGFLDFTTAAQLRGRAFEHDPTALQDVAVIGDRERHVGVLLHQKNGDAEFLAQRGEAPNQVFDHDRRQAERKFVHQQQLRIADDGAADRQHLALAA